MFAGAAGFVALSYELLWYRVYFLAKGAQGSAFAVLLAMYLLGLALGSAWAGRFCAKRPPDGGTHHMRVLALITAGSYLLAFLSIPAFGLYCTKVAVNERFPWHALTAAALGALFPVIAHVAVPPDAHAGRRLSYLYLANIVGSTLGTLLTGLWLFDVLSLRALAVLLTLAGLGMAGALLPLCGLTRKTARVSAVAVMAAACAVVGFARPLYDGLYERLELGSDYRADERFLHVLERRGGVITVDRQGTVRGHGTYDGQVRVFIGKDDPGSLFRPLALSAMHPSPRRVLQIGMATGAWTQILANNPEVEELVVIEIDRAYLELIPMLDEVRSVVSHPKVKIVIDDARRWLARNPDERFDAIVSNVSLHWVAGSSALLSTEFNRLAKRHLAPGGIYFYNATMSGRAKRTTAMVFDHLALIYNSVAAADAPIVFDEKRWRDVMSRYVIDGRHLFDLDTSEGREELEYAWQRMQPWESSAKIIEHTEGLELIADDNLGYEFDDFL